jgi:hypothetical protein
MYLQVCEGEEKEGNTRALASPGGARAHDVRVNSPSKSGPKPRKPTVSFCRLFLLRVCV